MAYLLDANVFIEAKNRYYGFDVCPGFWDWIDGSNAASRVFSIEKVGDELKAIADDLSAWAASKGTGLFLPTDPAMLTSLRDVASWAIGQHYEPGAVTTFLQGADSYLVAHARTLGYAVVTHEVPSTSLKRIKIPDACVGLGVRCVSPFEMLRNERARFVLGVGA
jgi:hypothetical protein